jgi:hypothetical protein
MLEVVVELDEAILVLGLELADTALVAPEELVAVAVVLDEMPVVPDGELVSVLVLPIELVNVLGVPGELEDVETVPEGVLEAAEVPNEKVTELVLEADVLEIVGKLVAVGVFPDVPEELDEIELVETPVDPEPFVVPEEVLEIPEDVTVVPEEAEFDGEDTEDDVPVDDDVPGIVLEDEIDVLVEDDRPGPGVEDEDEADAGAGVLGLALEKPEVGVDPMTPEVDDVGDVDDVDVVPLPADPIDVEPLVVDIDVVTLLADDAEVVPPLDEVVAPIRSQYAANKLPRNLPRSWAGI